MVKLTNCSIGTKIGVVVDMDPMIMIVVTKRQKDTNTIRQKGKKKKIQQMTKKTNRQELEQGGHRPLEVLVL